MMRRLLLAAILLTGCTGMSSACQNGKVVAPDAQPDASAPATMVDPKTGIARLDFTSSPRNAAFAGRAGADWRLPVHGSGTPATEKRLNDPGGAVEVRLAAHPRPHLGSTGVTMRAGRVGDGTLPGRPA
jgi:hypothetical protein